MTTLAITQELDDLIRERVSSGKYESQAEVVREALELLRIRDEREDSALREEIQKGLDDLDAGRVLTAEEAEAEFQSMRDAFIAGNPAR